MNFRTPITLPPFQRPVDHRRRGLSLGSCFAEEMGRRMRIAKFPLTLNPFGILFNPASIAASLDRLASGEPFREEDLTRCGESWVSLAHHGRFSGNDPAQVLEGINGALEEGARALAEADYLILTLGTAWVYEHLSTGRIAANCHKLPARDFRRYRLSPEEVAACLEQALAPYPGKQIILTVSPVRHGGDDPVENQLSKATLIVAAAALAEKYPNIGYFPAYEILTDELRDYRFYAPDMLHPSEVAIAYIWERFAQTALTAGARQLTGQLEKLRRAMEHRPLDPCGGAHQAFREKMASEIRALQTTWPDLDFSEETAYFA